MTQTDIANIALDLIGVGRISDFGEHSVTAEKIRLHWPLVRDELLRSREWNFAEKRAVLPAAAETPAFGYTFAWALPDDCLAVRECNDKPAGTSRADYEISGRYLLSNDGSAQLRYTALVESVSRWDASFCNAMAHALSAAVAAGLTTAPGLSERMRARAEQIALEAFGPNNRETKPRAVLAQTASSWLAARAGAGGNG